MLMTKRECAIVMAATGTQMLAEEDIPLLCQYASGKLGGRVRPCELRDIEIREELKEASWGDFIKLIEEASND